MKTYLHTPRDDDREFVSIREAMRLTGLGKNLIYKLLARGELESRKIRKRRLVVRKSISRLGVKQ